MHTLEALYIVKKLEEEKSETTSYHHSLLVHCWYAVVLILGKACCFEFIYHKLCLKIICTFITMQYLWLLFGLKAPSNQTLKLMMWTWMVFEMSTRYYLNNIYHNAGISTFVGFKSLSHKVTKLTICTFVSQGGHWGIPVWGRSRSGPEKAYNKVRYKIVSKKKKGPGKIKKHICSKIV